MACNAVSFFYLFLHHLAQPHPLYRAWSWVLVSRLVTSLFTFHIQTVTGLARCANLNRGIRFTSLFEIGNRHGLCTGAKTGAVFFVTHCKFIGREGRGTVFCISPLEARFCRAWFFVTAKDCDAIVVFQSQWGVQGYRT
jgi:hypothetical protein